MKKKTELVILALAIAATLLFLTGGISEDVKEVSDLELVSVIGIDKDGENVVLTTSAALDGDLERIVISGTEKESLLEAISDLCHSASVREPFFAHVENLIIGEDAARDENGVAPYIDYITRNLSIRLDANVYIVKGGTARDFIAKTVEKNVSISGMLGYIQKDVNMSTEGQVYTCGDVAVSLIEGTPVLLQAIEIKPEEEMLENSEEVISPMGFAVVKEGILVDFTGEDVTKGICILRGVAESEVVSVYLDGAMVSMDLKNIKADIEPVFSGDELKKIKIKLSFNGSIEQITGKLDVGQEEVLKALTDEIEKREAEKVAAAINSAKKAEMDYVGLYKILKTSHPLKFNMTEDQWNEIFKDVQISISAEAKIERAYDIINVTGKG